MSRHLLRRLIGALATLFAVCLVTFIALTATPGDAASALVGENATTADLETLRAQMGLNQPLPARFAAFLRDLVLRGDLGRSLVNNRAVTELLIERLPYTLALALIATALAAVVGALVGIAAAARAGTGVETLLMGGAALGLAIPAFWSALLLIMLFSLKLRWLPVVGAESTQHFILPTLTLAFPTAAIVARLMRSSLLDTLGTDYVRTAHAKGLTPRIVLTRHVVRNSLIPVVTVLGLHLGHLLGGAFIVETIFGLPGLGRLTVQAIFDRDYPVVMGAALLVALIYVTIHLLMDLAHGWLDPQVAGEAV